MGYATPIEVFSQDNSNMDSVALNN